MSDLPPPLADRSLDVRGYEYMPLLGGRLFASEFYALAVRNPRGGLAAQKLWWVAWQQVPAGSLAANEYSLCTLADFGSDMRAWNRARDVAMHGFVLCSDGRYYHPVIVEVAKKASAIREKARVKKAAQRANLRYPDAERQKDAAEGGVFLGGQATENIQIGQDCPQGRPGFVPAEGKVSKDTGELRSPDAVASSDQMLPLPEQSASMEVLPQGDLLGSPPPAQPEPPTPSKVLFGEGMQKLIDMSGRKRGPLASWIGKMRKEGAEDMTILSCIQDAHRRWLVDNTDPANPLEWISGAVKARLKPRGGPGSNPKREIPTEINGWVVKGVVEECNRLMQADGDGLWAGFTALIADTLEAGADPMVHIYPVMSRAKRKGITSIESLGWFSLSINGARTGVAAA